MPLDIQEIQGPLRVLAGPGTGKTHALVDLYEQAVRRGLAARDQILVLTFSTGAAGEISRRIDDRLKDDYGEAWISTFHSFCGPRAPAAEWIPGSHRHARGDRRRRRRGARCSGRRAPLGRFRERPARVRGADEAEPCTSSCASARRRGQRDRAASRPRVHLPGLPAAHAGGAPVRLS